ncbi:permease-like cell division protein FtsX [Flaviflexus equikiangi]|uniref:permease-like cell division protein FtsX n=1 Tax=Flaviflexus equikiangi TaxID=2758573 RepID=UPI0015F462D6|nr:permease-like cell division protein FtsX [Flaviflexus equikiangi]
MRIGFILSQTFKGIRSNRVVVASLALVTFVSLMFLGAASLLQTQVGNMKNEWYDKVEVTAFMCPLNPTTAQCAGGEATQDQIDAVEAFLNSDTMAPYVDEVYIESKADALENFREIMEGTTWVDAIDEDGMQVSFRVKLVNPEEFQIVADELRGQPGVEYVIDQREQLESIFSVLNGATVIAAVLAGTMILTALLLIVTMVRLSAMFRQKDTGIMRMVGASNGIIQTPFVLEGVFAALLGSLLSVGTLYGAVRYFLDNPASEETVRFVKLIDSGDVINLAPWLVGGALVVTALASYIALRRYTKV